VAAVVALGAACSTVQDARLAQDPASAVPGERTPTAAEVGLTTSGPLTIDAAVRTALGVRPSVLRARHEAEAAEARVTQAEAEALPRVSASAALEHVDSQNNGGSLRGRHRYQSLGYQVSWLVFDFGATSAFSRQAALQWLAAQADAHAAEAAAAGDVRAAYFTLLRQLRLRHVAREAVGQYEERLEQVRELVKYGKRIEVDATRAELDLGNARQDLVIAEDAVLLAQANLANALGLAETADWVPDDAPLTDADAPAFEECWRAAQERRPSLAAARAREQAASALVDARIAALYPSLTLGLSADRSGTESPYLWAWRFGPRVSWVPFDGFQNLSRIDEAVAALKSARTARAQEEQQAWLEVRRAWLVLEDARRRLELTSLTIRAAQQTLDLTRARFDAGASTSLELTDAQQSLVKARADDVQATAERDVATARLWQAMGLVDPPDAKAGGAGDSGRKP
jgi:outer membrane protein TolC